MLKNTCLKILRTVSLAAGALICLSLSACDNFLEGGLVKEDIKKEIEAYIGSAYTIELDCDENSGYFSPTSIVTVYPYSNFEIEFRMKKGFIFKGFQVIEKVDDSSDKKVNKTALEFSDIKTIQNGTGLTVKVNVKILDNKKNLCIYAVCGTEDENNGPSIQYAYVARSKEDYENGNYNYLIQNRLYVRFRVLEKESEIKNVLVSENNNEYNFIKDFTVETDDISEGWYFVSFYYNLEDESNGNRCLYLQAVDTNNNAGDVFSSAYFYNDTGIDANFYLTNTSVNFDAWINGSTRYQVHDDTNNNYSYLISNSTIVTEDIEKKQWKDSDSSHEMKLTLHSDSEKSYGLNNDPIYIAPDRLKWKYSYSSDRDELESKQMNSISFLSGVSDVDVYIPVNDKDAVTYVRVECTDLIGNKKSVYYEIPCLAKTVSKYIYSYPYSTSSGTVNYKAIRVKTSDYSDKNNYYSILYTHNMSRTSDEWTAIGDYNNGAPGSRELTADLDSSNYSSYSSLTSSDFYTQLVYKYNDNYNNERYIYGYISDVQTADYVSSTSAPKTISPSVTISADEKDTHSVTVTIPDSAYNYYDAFYVRANNVFSYIFDEGKSKTFKIDTKNFYTANTAARKDFTFYIFGVKNGIEYSVAYTISSSNSSIKDNVAPYILNDDVKAPSRDYTGKYLKIPVYDIGSGFFSSSRVNIKYFKYGYGVYMVERTAWLWADDGAVYIPIGHLPGYGETYTISLNLSDSASNELNYSFEFTTDHEHTSYSSYSFPPYVVLSYNTSDFDYSLSYNGSSASQFRLKSKELSNGNAGQFNNLRLDQIIFSYDGITSGSQWVHGAKDAYSLTSYSYFSPYYVYPSSIGAAAGFYRIFLQEKNSELHIGPIYLYQTGKQMVSVKDTINTDYGIQVYSDKPFLIHTLWNEYNFGDNLSEWESHCVQSAAARFGGYTSLEVNLKYVSGDYSTNPYYYYINTTYVPENCYYIAIIWFADGTCLASPVRQKQ